MLFDINIYIYNILLTHPISERFLSYFFVCSTDGVHGVRRGRKAEKKPKRSAYPGKEPKRSAFYFPTQNLENIRSIISSATSCPVMPPRALADSVMSMEMRSGVKPWARPAVAVCTEERAERRSASWAGSVSTPCSAASATEKFARTHSSSWAQPSPL